MSLYQPFLRAGPLAIIALLASSGAQAQVQTDPQMQVVLNQLLTIEGTPYYMLSRKMHASNLVRKTPPK